MGCTSVRWWLSRSCRAASATHTSSHSSSGQYHHPSPPHPHPATTCRTPYAPPTGRSCICPPPTPVPLPGRQEAELLSKLHHPHVIRFYGVCYHEGDFYIVTELCENTLQVPTHPPIQRSTYLPSHCCVTPALLGSLSVSLRPHGCLSAAHPVCPAPGGQAHAARGHLPYRRPDRQRHGLPALQARRAQVGRDTHTSLSTHRQTTLRVNVIDSLSR